jgi:hypothetical protein
MIGQRFGRLTVKRQNGRRFICRCDCGEYAAPTAYALKSGRTESCGVCTIRDHLRARRAPYLTQEEQTPVQLYTLTVGPSGTYTFTPQSGDRAPAPLWTADFKNAVYERGGVATSLDDMFQDYGPGPTAGVGFGAGTNPYVKHGSPAEADLGNRATFVLEVDLTTDIETEILASASSEDFSAGRDLYVVTKGDYRTRIDTYGPVTNATYNSNAYAPTGSIKVAVTLAGDHAAFSVNGGPVVSGGPDDDVAMTWFYFTLPLGSGAKLKKITAYAAQDDADLPALST